MDAHRDGLSEESEDVFWDRRSDQTLRQTDTDVDEYEVSRETESTDEFDSKIDSWKEQLLDLSRRNNLVDFTATKTKSLPFERPHSPAVAEKLRSGPLHIRKHRDGLSDPDVVSLDSSEVLSSRLPDATESSLEDITLNERKFLRERGVQTLYIALGTLEWWATGDTKDVLESPLFLLSVNVDEQTVNDSDRHNYVVTSETNSLTLNPALRKKLQMEHGIELPPDDAFGLECIDAAFEAVYTEIEGIEHWRINPDVILGVFDFAKFSLYTDLESNRDVVKADPIVRALNDDPSGLQATEGDIRSPSPDELDEAVDQRDVYQVLDADSSQQAAIEAAKSGRSFVIQGPPGTGKSQTISNIVAEKLAAGERVLFVSEKQAALNVVKNRLDDVGLGRFCLEAHGRKAGKKRVLDSIEAELSSTPIKAPSDRVEKLEGLLEQRRALNQYGDDLLSAPDGFGVTPFEAFGVLATHTDVPSVRFGLDTALGHDQRTLDGARELLDELAYFSDELEQFHSHPWRHTTLTRWKIDTEDRVNRILSGYIAALEELSTTARRTDEHAGLEIGSVEEFSEAISVLERLRDRPDIEWEPPFLSQEFRSLDARLETFADQERRIAELRANLQDRYRESFFDEDGRELFGEVDKYGSLRFFRPSYKSVSQRFEGHSEPTYSPGFHDQKRDAQELMELQQLLEDRDEYQDVVTALGGLYHGASTDWKPILEAHRWLSSLDEFDLDIEPLLNRLVTEDSFSVEEILREANDVYSEYTDAATAFGDIVDMDAVTIDGTAIEAAPFDAVRDRTETLADSIDKLQSWIEFQQHLDEIDGTICEAFVDEFLDAGHTSDLLVPCFEKRFFTVWLNEIYDETTIGEFSGDTFRKRLDDFRGLDELQQELAKVAVQHHVTRNRPQLSLEHADSSEQVVVRREVQKQRMHKPLRELFAEAGGFITSLKPCFMMSPLSVAQLLTVDAIEFDCVIFDEASQVPPQDAISSLLRADQAIIAGDSKQLPPTEFFDVDVETAAGVRADLDSILEEANAVLPSVKLSWHYRSKSAELIEFSNALYYGGELQTFPENNPRTRTGVEFVHVEDGVYDRGGTRTNQIEAERVVDLVAQHAAESPDKSLGVVAFSQAQEQAIREEIQTRRGENDTLESFITEDDILGEFFVKNLEMVQGDERDRMIFSVGYGPDETGDVTMNFGPLNANGGERRLNVAVTRARERVTVVSSLLPDDIDVSRTDSTGVEHFKRYLEYARGQRANTPGQEAAGADTYDSLIASELEAELEARGYDLEPVSTSGYSLDFGVRDPDTPEQFALGIEIDGSAYRWSNTARDRDRIRPTVLDSFGWDIYRVWAPDWVTNRSRILREIENRIVGDPAPASDDAGSIDIDVMEYEPEEYTREELAALQTDIDTYRGPNATGGRGGPVTDAMSAEIRQETSGLIREYGPLHRDIVYRHVANEWGHERVTPTISDRLDEITAELGDSNRVYVHDEFLWPPKSFLEFTVRQHEDDKRRIEHVPLEEIAHATFLIIESGFRMTREDLIVETTRLLGYERVGNRIHDRVSTAIELLENLHFIEGGDELYRGEASDLEAFLLQRVYDEA